MQNCPSTWTPGDLSRFNAVMDCLYAYMLLDYARKAIPGNVFNTQFTQARQTDLQQLLISVNTNFQSQFGAP